MDKKILIIFIVAIAAVAAGVYYFSYKAGYEAGKEAGLVAAKTSAAEAVTNPLEAMPSTNPFEKTVNPFKELYKNPFK